MREKIINLTYETIDEINSGRQTEVQKETSTLLYGVGSELDSLDLITLIVSLEQKINQIFNLNITLADERALTQVVSPFSTVKHLVDYMELLIKEKINSEK